MNRTAALDFAERNSDSFCTDDGQIMMRGCDGCDVVVDGVPGSFGRTSPAVEVLGRPRREIRNSRALGASLLTPRAA